LFCYAIVCESASRQSPKGRRQNRRDSFKLEPGRAKKFFDILEEEKSKVDNSKREIEKKVNKGIRWMPWLSEAKKDVISCEKLRGGANNR
jgi:hypothetical protein